MFFCFLEFFSAQGMGVLLDREDPEDRFDDRHSSYLHRRKRARAMTVSLRRQLRCGKYRDPQVGTPSDRPDIIYLGISSLDGPFRASLSRNLPSRTTFTSKAYFLYFLYFLYSVLPVL